MGKKTRTAHGGKGSFVCRRLPANGRKRYPPLCPLWLCGEYVTVFL